MARIILYLCAGICLSSAITSFAQTLPGKPAASEVIGKSLSDQKKWALSQLPRNSVLYQYQSSTTAIDPAPYSIKKAKLPGFNLPGKPSPLTTHQPNIYLQTYLKEQKRQDSPWKKKYWWSNTNIKHSGELVQDSKTN